MSQEQNSDRNSNRKRTAVDYVLGDKPTEFQLSLLQLGRELSWDENDPGFAVSLAMGQVEKVLALYPDKIKAALDAASEKAEVKWERTQEALKVEALKTQLAAQGIDDQLARVKSFLDLEIQMVKGAMLDERLEMSRVMRDERKAAQKLIADERAALETQVAAVAEQQEAERDAVQKLLTDEQAAMTKQADKIADRQKEVIEARTKELIVLATKTNQERADTQVKSIVASAKAAHYWQSLSWAFGSAIGLVCLTLLVAGWVERYSTWGSFERWNKEHLEICREAGSITCNFYIEEP